MLVSLSFLIQQNTGSLARILESQLPRAGVTESKTVV